MEIGGSVNACRKPQSYPIQPLMYTQYATISSKQETQYNMCTYIHTSWHVLSIHTWTPPSA